MAPVVVITSLAGPCHKHGPFRYAHTQHELSGPDVYGVGDEIAGVHTVAHISGPPCHESFVPFQPVAAPGNALPIWAGPPGR